MESEVPCYPFAEALTVAGQFEIDNAIRIVVETVGDRELIGGEDVADIIDALLDRRLDLD